MTPRGFASFRIVVMFFALASLVAWPCSGASAASVALGDSVPLKGAAPGLDTVYLFLTGPNLPAGGVRLENIRAPVVTGDASTFTRVDVIDDRWSYTWYTRTSGGLPDAGSYTVWVVDRPAGRFDLQNAWYSTVSVGTSKATLTAEVGALAVNSSPPGAGVFLDGKPGGNTPVRLEGILAGNHTVVMEKDGYMGAELPVTVQGGSTTEITVALSLAATAGRQDTMATTGAETSTTSSPSPASVPWPAAGAVAAIVLAVHGGRKVRSGRR
ncbi:MAG: PEGA domain-containing protein [Methanoregulaceae archaeon]|nr:PEGA domain-containing protein [Methanoregulaceae archaeon]